MIIRLAYKTNNYFLSFLSKTQVATQQQNKH